MTFQIIKLVSLQVMKNWILFFKLEYVIFLCKKKCGVILWLDRHTAAYFLTFFKILILFLGEFEIGNIVPSPEGESQKVKVKVRVNLHGIFTVSTAQMYEKKENSNVSFNPNSCSIDFLIKHFGFGSSLFHGC